MEDDAKVILGTIAVIILVFAVLLATKFFNNNSPATINDLHQQNLDGESSSENYLYNGFSFVKIDNLWYTQVQHENNRYDIPLHYGPKEIETIPINGKLDLSFFGEEVFITFNPLDENLQYVALGSAELSLNLVKGLGIIPRAACDRNQTAACEARPIITCASNVPAIYVKQADSESIELKGNCAVISGKNEGLVKSVDRFLLYMYGVMR